jgi:hypothetical protein
MQGYSQDLNIEGLFKQTTVIKDEIYTYQERRKQPNKCLFCETKES